MGRSTRRNTSTTTTTPQAPAATGETVPAPEQPAAPEAATPDAPAAEPGQGAELATARDQAPEDAVNAAEATSAATPDAAEPAGDATTDPASPAQGEGEDDQTHGLQTVGLAGPPSIDSVMGGLLPASAGAVITRPEVYLTGEQAVLQLRVYETLSSQGKTLRGQGDVYGWLLGQMLAHLVVGGAD